MGIVLGFFVGFERIWWCCVILAIVFVLHLQANCNFGLFHCCSPFAAFLSNPNHQKIQSHAILA